MGAAELAAPIFRSPDAPVFSSCWAAKNRLNVSASQRAHGQLPDGSEDFSSLCPHIPGKITCRETNAAIFSSSLASSWWQLPNFRKRINACMISILTAMVRALSNTEGSMVTPCSAMASGAVLRPLRPGFEITDCGLDTENPTLFN